MSSYYRGQSRSHSMLETTAGILIGFFVAYITNLYVLPLFGFNVTYSDSLAIAAIFTIVSFLRSYFVRRLFNYLHLRDIL